MKNSFVIFSVITSIFHFYFMALESYFWTKPLGMKVFRMNQAAAESTRVLALNQGFYNGILAAGLLWGLIRGDDSITLFCLVSVVIAGIVGALTVTPKIFFIQCLPALVALISYFVFIKSTGPV